MRCAWLLLLGLGGCLFGAGPTMGYRAGKATIGWEGSAGAADWDDEDFRGGRISFGQAWWGEHHDSYAAATAMRMRVSGEIKLAGMEATLGYGMSETGRFHPVAGIAPTAAVVHVADECVPDDYWIASFSIGARAIGGDLELYIAPRVTWVVVPCLGGGSGVEPL